MMNSKMYINGKWVESENDHSIEVINPANKEKIAKVPRATRKDTQRAIDAAREAFEEGVWSELSAHERAEFLMKIADKLTEKKDELAALEAMNNGKTKMEADFDVSDSIDCFRYYAGLITAPDGQTVPSHEPMQSIVVQEPMGVVGLIVPWNFPLLMGVWKIAPALAAGNTIVFKPAELTPMTAIELFKIIDEIGLPKGVANLVLGKGSESGQMLAESQDIDMVSFTGSTEIGRQVMKAASSNIKKVSLELGGKSPNIIFDDADFETAVDYALFGIFYGAGQVCTAGSRILVQEGIYNQFIDRLIERAKHIRVGPGMDKNVEMGAITSSKQLDSILDYVEIGKKEGATLALGGKRLTEDGLEKGFFMEPTIFTDVHSDMRIVQEEIFGPVITVQKFKNEAEAVKLANDTDYGLAGAVFSQDGAKAMRVIKKVRAGITWINTYHSNHAGAPWGGYKQSGIGRGLGTQGLHEFQEVKQINVNLAVEPVGWFSN
ncbi:aldehyde dehydrogenase family protein [Lentibacillus lipolyticus]|nr:aldehyde dehydrogenase family protein [Lentibacillus lipolyticus]